MGAITSAYGPSSIRESYIGGILNKKARRGKRKAADFPEPVGAKPIISLIDMPMGRACIWMGLGFVYP